MTQALAPPVTVRHDIVTGTPFERTRRSRQASHGVEEERVCVNTIQIMESTLHQQSPISSRKRPRENETEGQRLKREKAAERQRRKRERDRNTNAGISVVSQFQPPVDHHHHLQHQVHPPPPPPPQPISHSVSAPQPTQPVYSASLSPEEISRRDRVRAAARERQRKHRLLVKQRKMRELGLDMGNEIPGMEDTQYRVNSDGQYQQVMSHEIQQHPPQHVPPQGGDIPFPQGQLGGQTFASTLLLSFSCAPLLKAHLMRTLHMNNDELASLEPVLAEAWERWDHAVSSRLPKDLSRSPHFLETCTLRRGCQSWNTCRSSWSRVICHRNTTGSTTWLIWNATRRP